MPYTNPYAGALARLLSEQGQIAADRTARAGEIWGNAVRGVGSAVSNTLRQEGQRRIDAPRRALEQAQIAEQMRQIDASGKVRGVIASNIDPTTGKPKSRAIAGGIAGIDPEQAAQWWARASQEDKDKLALDIKKAEEVSRGAGSILSLPPNEQAPMYGQWRNGVIAKGLATAEQIPEQYTPGWLRYKMREAMSVDALAKSLEPHFEKVSNGDSLINTNDPTKPIYTAPPKPVTFGSLTPAQDAKGQRIFVRTGSDGQTYDVDGKVMPPGSYRPVMPKGPAGGEPLEAVIGKDGNPTLVPRSQARGMRPATSREQPREDELKTAGFYDQMVGAIQVLDALEPKLTDKELYQIQTLPQEGLVGMMNRGELSENAKRYLRAFEEYTEARLRPNSGAAINDKEYERDRRTYARQYGETPQLAKDRKASRGRALSALQRRAGRALQGNPTATIRARDPQGNLHEAKAGTPLPDGWVLDK
jgi:hypothetical protein